jgi:hypothetical protein
MRRITPLLTLLALGACGPETYFEGAVCPAPELLAEFEDGDDLDIVIVLDPCPPGCGGDAQTECSVTRDGDTIDIDAQGQYRKRSGGAAGCTAVCRPLTATCTVNNLDAGTYTIHSGTHSLEVTLPSADPPKYDPDCSY